VAEHQLLPNKYINYMSYLLVNPDMTFAIKAFKSLCEGDLFFNCVVQISYRASFCTLARSSTRESYLTSIQHVISLFSTKLLVDKTALYGSITVSETFGDGKTENVASIRSGCSSSNSYYISLQTPRERKTDNVKAGILVGNQCFLPVPG
jgi:hypothetical protein